MKVPHGFSYALASVALGVLLLAAAGQWIGGLPKQLLAIWIPVVGAVWLMRMSSSAYEPPNDVTLRQYYSILAALFAASMLLD